MKDFICDHLICENLTLWSPETYFKPVVVSFCYFVGKYLLAYIFQKVWANAKGRQFLGMSWPHSKPVSRADLFHGYTNPMIQGCSQSHSAGEESKL